MKRRSFLAGGLAGIALVGLTRKSSRADGPARARRVLILNAGGGLRTTAAFNASTRVALNPWGVLGTAGALRLGNVLTADTSTITTATPSWPGGGECPSIEQAAAAFAVIAACDHAPDGSSRAGDHTDDVPRMATGYFAKPDAPGVFTAINRFLGGNAAAPVATIGGADFGTAPPAWIADKPIGLAFDQLPNQPPTGGSAAVGRPLEDALDAAALANKRHLARQAIESVINTKGTLRKFGPVLADKRLRFDNAQYETQTLDGITNKMLLEAVGNGSGAVDRGARSVALAIRLLQMGSPAAAVSIGGFDTHDSEVQKAPQLYSRFARFLAGIHFALTRIPDPGGGMLIEHSLVVTTSEFGRSGVEPNGFNAGEGTDHGSSPAWRNQAHVVFGAGVKPKKLNPTDENNVPTEKPCSTHCLLATIAAAVGAPQSELDKLWPPGSPLYPEGGPLWDLWA
jgi:uncharacterized protein (DUF1501 family)